MTVPNLRTVYRAAIEPGARYSTPGYDNLNNVALEELRLVLDEIKSRCYSIEVNFEVLDLYELTRFQNYTYKSYCNFSVLDLYELTRFQNKDAARYEEELVLDLYELTRFQNSMLSFEETIKVLDL